MKDNQRRVIKFRAWDKREQCFAPLQTVGNIIYELVYNPKSDVLEHFELMQFTELHDKDGIEIYEGDIVRLIAKSESKKLGELNKEWIVQVMWDSRTCAFVLTKERTESALTWNFGDTDFNGFEFKHEVIGNIYQNPELL